MHETFEPNQMHVAVDLMVLSVRDGRLRLPLARRASPPYAGRWALPGRLIGMEESAETAVKALMEEMLPVGEAFFEQLYTFSAINRDPRGRVISTAYLVIVPWRRLESALERGGGLFQCFTAGLAGGALSLEGPDGAKLTAPDLAFDHGHIVALGIQRLRGKIDYTDIGFRFLNDCGAFSLAALQEVFEAVLDKPLDAGNFRRFIRSRYEETRRIEPINQAEKRGRGRPAALYRLCE